MVTITTVRAEGGKVVRSSEKVSSKSLAKKYKSLTSAADKKAKELKKKKSSGKKGKSYSQVMKTLSKKVSYRKGKQQPKIAVELEKKETPSIFDEANKFFKNELEEVKKTLFFK